jgi:argininosuccinate lyase
MHATDLAIEFAQQGLPFRDAYRKAADPALWEDRDASESLAARVSEGSGVNLGLEKLKERLAAL